MARMRTIFLASVLAAAAVQAGAASVYRCTTALGIVYQEVPCESGAAERSWNADYPPANIAERDRIMQREAALDARMLKRAEIEAAERMAKEARWAREAELEAERQRAKAAEAQYFYPAYPVYGGFRPRPHFRPGNSALRY